MEADKITDRQRFLHRQVWDLAALVFNNIKYLSLTGVITKEQEKEEDSKIALRLKKLYDNEGDLEIKYLGEVRDFLIEEYKHYFERQ